MRVKGRWALWKKFTIGMQDNPMMDRLRLIQTPWFGIYVHFIYREDLDEFPHDHPWRFWRMVLRGGYLENYLTEPIQGRVQQRHQLPLRPSFFPLEHAHRITYVEPKTVTLVVVGRKVREWGFFRWEQLQDGEYRDWIQWQDYVGARPL